jgi:hypothetical protein
MPIMTGQFSNLWTRKIDQTFFEAWDEEKEEWPEFLHNETSNQHNETYQSFAGVANWKPKAEMANAQQDTYNLADLIVTEFDPYGIEIILSREMIDDAKYGEVMDMTRDAGHAGRNTVEANCATVLDNAFTVNEYDGVPLISAAHPYRKTGLAGTQSNLATGILNDVNIKTGINLFNELNDEAGKRIKMNPSNLITHKNNQFEVATLFQSSQRAGTANNDKNVLPDMKFTYSTFMSSETAWLLQSKQHKMIHFYRIKPEFIKRKYMNPNGSQSWDGYLRENTVNRQWRGVVGSTGL